MTTPPKISIISPSFNCAKYVRRCIDSVLAQNYPNIEHIIVDGASKDGTVEILKEYPHLRWVSEPDSGEAEALNKALRMASGEIITWLNVDDCYFRNDVFDLVARAYALNPDCDVFYGKGLAIDEQENVIMYRTPLTPVTLGGLMRWFLNLNLFQPAMFYTGRLMREVGEFRQDLFFSIDYDYWLRISAKGFKWHLIDTVFAKATLAREGAKSGSPVEEQHRNWQLISASFEHHLSRAERVNFWRDFYLYRIKNPLGYTAPVELPNDEIPLIGMTLAFLELHDVANATQCATILAERAPESADSYWIMSEVLHRVGHNAQSTAVLHMETAKDSGFSL